MDLATASRTALLLHDGELDDLRPLLDAIGVSSVERLGRLSDGDADRTWDLVVGTPAKLVDPSQYVGGFRVCISESDSRSLRAMLERANVSFVIVRPVHPQALKHVLSQALYAGTENRKSIRRASGQSVRFRSGWRSRWGSLADLSETGCRLLAPKCLGTGRDLIVYIPRRAGSTKTLSVPGTVVRGSLTDGPQEERHAIHVCFDELPYKVAQSLSEIVESLADGPAVLPTLDSGADVARRPPTSAVPSGDSPEVPEASPEDAEDRAALQLVESSTEGSDLRSHPRLAYSARIIALGKGPARVLTTEDISPGGLRAEAHPDVAVGDELQVAIPLPGEAEPLVAKARVVRNQDELALAFEELAPESYERLQRRLEHLPEVESSFSEDEAPVRVIVSKDR